ncbi:MAG: hypothetical protein ACE5G2_07355 [Candidatus Krumholzibacteriia bacterium]
MNRRIRILALASWAIVLGSTSVSAHPVTPLVDRTQANQNVRITVGLRSGSLTVGEARYLRAQQSRIRVVEARAKADGVWTPRERARVARLQEQANADICRLEHNCRRR